MTRKNFFISFLLTFIVISRCYAFEEFICPSGDILELHQSWSESHRIEVCEEIKALRDAVHDVFKVSLKKRIRLISTTESFGGYAGISSLTPEEIQIFLSQQFFSFQGRSVERVAVMAHEIGHVLSWGGISEGLGDAIVDFVVTEILMQLDREKYFPPNVSVKRVLRFSEKIDPFLFQLSTKPYKTMLSDTKKEFGPEVFGLVFKEWSGDLQKHLLSICSDDFETIINKHTNGLWKKHGKGIIKEFWDAQLEETKNGLLVRYPGGNEELKKDDVLTHLAGIPVNSVNGLKNIIYTLYKKRDFNESQTYSMSLIREGKPQTATVYIPFTASPYYISWYIKSILLKDLSLFEKVAGTNNDIFFNGFSGQAAQKMGDTVFLLMQAAGKMGFPVGVAHKIFFAGVKQKKLYKGMGEYIDIVVSGDAPFQYIHLTVPISYVKDIEKNGVSKKFIIEVTQQLVSSILRFEDFDLFLAFS